MGGFCVETLVGCSATFFVIAYATLLIIDKYTRHGEAEMVPDLRGMYATEAGIMLEAQGLRYEVIDSTYDRSKPFGVIVEQTPPMGSFLKKGRPVYLIINAQSIRKVPVPDLRDLSFRQAISMLNATGLVMGDTIYEPSEYRDLVLDVRQDGLSVQAGTRLPEGTRLDLVVGQGLGTESVFVPDLLGLSVSDVRTAVLGAALVPGAVNYDTPPSDDAAKQLYMVYSQDPAAGMFVPAGTRIDIWLSTDQSKVKKTNILPEEDFF